jgi:cytochrome c peroxidase
MKTKLTLAALFILLGAVIIISCKKNTPPLQENEEYSSTPVLPSTPYNYKASQNDHLATVGRVLFYDKKLSLNNSVSCSSCHQQSRAFCDNKQFSTGLTDQQTPRNSPSIFARNGRVFWDGRASSLTDLALRPVQNHVEMRFENLEGLAAKLSKTEYYPGLFKKAFPQSGTIDVDMIQTALAEFLRNFNFSDNKLRRSLMQKEELNASEKLGKMLFFGKAHCSNCHHIENPFPNDSIFIPGDGNGYGFTDESHNIGLDLEYTDNGIGKITGDPNDNGAFMVPVLLNVEFTAPYMHDGRFKTLEEVVEHYNSGIQNHPNLDFNLRDISSVNHLTENEIFALLDKNKNGDIEPFELQGLPPVKLGLSPAEKKSLVDFLKTLSDPHILTDAKFSNPFLMK